ncbi:MAG: glycosyltransferase family 9 protein [Opitutales bacterium]
MGNTSQEQSPEPPNDRLLVIKPSSLGDIMHGLQVVTSIRNQKPDAHITWVAGDGFAGLLETCEAVDEVLVFHRKGGAGAFLQLLCELRRSRYDVVLDMQGLARSGLMTWAARAERKLGRADARECAGWFYGERTPAVRAERPHAVEILLEFLPLLGLRRELVGAPRFELPVSEYAATGSEPPILIFPESRRPEKTWPYFTEFLSRAAREFPGRSFLWCGSSACSAACPEASNVRNLAGKTGLQELLSLVQTAAAVVANDSGPVHMAAAVGTPVLALFGPTPPEAYGPYPVDAPRHIVVRAPDGRMPSLKVSDVEDNFRNRLLHCIASS